MLLLANKAECIWHTMAVTMGLPGSSIYDISIYDIVKQLQAINAAQRKTCMALTTSLLAHLPDAVSLLVLSATPVLACAFCNTCACSQSPYLSIAQYSETQIDSVKVQFAFRGVTF